MARHRVVVELEDEVLQRLQVLGAPDEALEYLATSVAAGVQQPAHSRREQTDKSLQRERTEADARSEQRRAAVDARADAVVDRARARR